METSERNAAGRIVLAGGSGFLGQHLASSLAASGFEVVVLARRLQPSTPIARWVQWDGASLGPWARELDGAGALVNMAGRSVNCRYDARNREEILESRLRSTRVLADALIGCANPPPVWINSSSATIYRDTRDRPMDESSGELGSGFSVDVCRRWEEVFFEARTHATRKVALRTALVLGRGGGVMEAFGRIVRLGLGGTLGDGGQQVSWVQVDDFTGAIRWLLEHPELDGVVNCSAPEPLPNREFMRALREAHHQPIGLPAAAWMLEIGAFFLRTETELLLKSRWVLPRRLLESGYQFRYPRLKEALCSLVAP